MTTPDSTARSDSALGGVDAVRKVFAAWDRHCEANARTNAAIPAISATRAEREVYEERYRASEEAKRDWFAAMHDFVADPAARAIPSLALDSDKLMDTLGFAKNVLHNVSAGSGYCMCGDPIESHGIGSGHSPVDSDHHMIAEAIDAINAVLPTPQNHLQHKG